MTEKTSDHVARLASRGLREPLSLSPDEIQTLAASCLAQAPDRPLVTVTVTGGASDEWIAAFRAMMRTWAPDVDVAAYGQ